MTTREKFKRAVIEAIHGLPYDEAIEKEAESMINNGKLYKEPYPITIGRVMQALENSEVCYCPERNDREVVVNLSYDERVFEKKVDLVGVWKLTKENGQECTDDEQSDECIEKLLELLENK
jgi:hypothetical protein